MNKTSNRNLARLYAMSLVEYHKLRALAKRTETYTERELVLNTAKKFARQAAQFLNEITEP